MSTASFGIVGRTHSREDELPVTGQRRKPRFQWLRSSGPSGNLCLFSVTREVR